MSSRRTRSTRWTKKDIAFLRGRLDEFVLCSEFYVPPEQIGAAIERHRVKIVLDGLRSFRSMLDHRAQGHVESWKHFQANPIIYGQSTPEIVARFGRLAEEAERAVAKLDRLIARVETEGTPPEVMEYVPARLGSKRGAPSPPGTRR